MEVTNAMVHAAIKQAVKDKLLPTHSTVEAYTHNWESMERIIKAAIDKEDQQL